MDLWRGEEVLLLGSHLDALISHVEEMDVLVSMSWELNECLGLDAH